MEVVIKQCPKCNKERIMVITSRQVRKPNSVVNIDTYFCDHCGVYWEEKVNRNTVMVEADLFYNTPYWA